MYLKGDVRVYNLGGKAMSSSAHKLIIPANCQVLYYKNKYATLREEKHSLCNICGIIGLAMSVEKSGVARLGKNRWTTSFHSLNHSRLPSPHLPLPQSLSTSCNPL